MSKNKLYVLLSTACAAGYIWLAITYHQRVTQSMEPGACLFKRITNIPCPSCGSTRSVLSLLEGDIQNAWFWNPFGFILIVTLIVSPIWITYDVVSGKKTLLDTYIKTELILKRKWIAIFAILLVILNWVWNILKGL